MTDDASTSGGHGVTPQHVEYDPLTGVPSEFNEYLPHDSAEWKKWKAAQEGPEALEKLTLKDSKTGEYYCTNVLFSALSQHSHGSWQAQSPQSVGILYVACQLYRKSSC